MSNDKLQPVMKESDICLFYKASLVRSSDRHEDTLQDCGHFVFMVLSTPGWDGSISEM